MDKRYVVYGHMPPIGTPVTMGNNGPVVGKVTEHVDGGFIFQTCDKETIDSIAGPAIKLSMGYSNG